MRNPVGGDDGALCLVHLFLGEFLGLSFVDEFVNVLDVRCADPVFVGFHETSFKFLILSEDISLIIDKGRGFDEWVFDCVTFCI